MPRIIAAIVLVAVLAIGGGFIATTAYQAGLDTASTTATGAGGTVVTPVVVPAYGYGWHPFGFGFGIFGFFAALFFLFIVFGLIRAILYRGGPGRRGGWGASGWGGPGAYGQGRYGHGHSPWEARAHETFDDWHRHAHDPADRGPAASSGPSGPGDSSGPATPGTSA